MLSIVGDTYEIRDQLKALGCLWDKDAECWIAPDAGKQAIGQQMADAEPLRKWRVYADTLAWAPGAFTGTTWDAGLRACSIGLSLDMAMREIGDRITTAGGSCPPNWLERNVGRAFEHAKPAGRATRGSAPLGPGARSHQDDAPRITKPVFAETKLQKFAGPWAHVVDTAWLADRSPVDPLSTSSDGFLRALYQPGEKVVIADVFKSQGNWMWSHDQGFEPSRRDFQAWDANDPKHEAAPPLRGGPEFPHRGPVGIWYLCNPVDGQFRIIPKEEDQHGRQCWSRRFEACVTDWRYIVFESDEADPREWMGAIVQLPLRIAAIYTSAGKSVHVLVRIDAETKAQFDEWRATAKRTMIPLGADPGCMSAVRLTRLPGCWREGKEEKGTGKVVPFPRPQMQKLLYLNPGLSQTGGADDVALIERTAVRDTFGPWERWAGSIVNSDPTEVDPEDVKTLLNGLSQFAGERAKAARDSVRRWAR